MKIVDDITRDRMKFLAVRRGEVFVYGSSYYIRINEVRDGSVGLNAVQLANGEAFRFMPDDLVRVVNHKLVIES